MKSIPILEPSITELEMELVVECLNSGWISSKGNFVKKFEDNFSKLVSNRPCLSTCNGTTSLHLALVALGIGPGDEVIVPDLTFAATINAVIHCGATPVICDVDEHSWNISNEILLSLITKKTKAVIFVHLLGLPCEITVIRKELVSRDILIIEDAAEALGSSINKKPVGSFGDAAIFSFFGNKTLTTGEGGMTVFKTKRQSDKARVLRDHGMSPNRRYWHNFAGFNYRMTNLQAAIGVAQLQRLPDILKRKIDIGEKYKAELSHPMVRFQQNPKNHTNSYWISSVRFPNQRIKNLVSSNLSHKGIETRNMFYPLHKQPPYKGLRTNVKKMNSINISRETLFLPSSATLTPADQNLIIEVIVGSLAKL